MWEAEENLKTGKFLGKLRKHVHETKNRNAICVYTQAIREHES